MTRQVLSARDMAGLNIARANPGITIHQMQIALDLKHKTTAARLLARLEDFGLIERTRSVCGAKRREAGRSQFHLQSKAAA